MGSWTLWRETPLRGEAAPEGPSGPRKGYPFATCRSAQGWSCPTTMLRPHRDSLLPVPHPEATGHKICRLTLLTASRRPPPWSLLTRVKGKVLRWPTRPSLIGPPLTPLPTPPSLALVTSLHPLNVPTPGLPQGLCSGLGCSSLSPLLRWLAPPNILCSDATLHGLSSDLWDPKPWPPSDLSSCSSSVPFAPPCCPAAVLHALGPEAGSPPAPAPRAQAAYRPS